MPGFKYEVEFNGPADIVGQLSSIKAALDECSAKSLRFSQGAQKGLEAEAARFKVWADTLNIRRDTSVRASAALTSAVEAYREAEQSVHSKMQQAVSSAATGGGASDGSGNPQYGGGSGSGNVSGSSRESESGSGSDTGSSNTAGGEGAYGVGAPPNGCVNWDNSTGGGDNWWSNIPPDIKWPIIGGIIGGIIGQLPGIGFPPGAIWELIRNWLNRGRTDAIQVAGGGEPAGDDDYSGYEGLLPEGGKISDKEGDYDANGEEDESGNLGEQGEDDGLDEYDTDQDLSMDDEIGLGGDIGIGGTPGMGGGSGSDSGFNTGAQSGGGAFSSPDADFDDALSSVNAQNGYSEFSAELLYSEKGKYALGYQDSLSQSEKSADVGIGTRTDYGTDKDTELSAGGGLSGIATPLIAVGGLAAGAAAGAGIAGKKGGADGKGLKTSKAESGKPIAPIIEAKQSGGTFAGNLNGQYIMLGTTLALAFAGFSISSSVLKKSKKKPEDDRYIIGYGISAIFADYDNYINSSTVKG